MRCNRSVGDVPPGLENESVEILSWKHGRGRLR